MQLIGFNLTKISGKREINYKRSKVNTEIEFTGVEKDKVEMLKDSEAVKISFNFNVSYKEEDSDEEQGNISFEGIILLSVTKEEAKEFQKEWKKKRVPKSSIVYLYNVILKKCSIIALQLEDDLGLPPHIPFPQVKLPKE